MARSIETLDNNKKGFSLIQNINVLELIVLLFVLSMIVLAFIEADFRADFKELATIVISGYLGNKVPK